MNDKTIVLLDTNITILQLIIDVINFFIGVRSNINPPFYSIFILFMQLLKPYWLAIDNQLGSYKFQAFQNQ